MRSIKRLIATLCNADQKYANDDKLLIATIWNMQGWTDTKGVYENLKHVSSPETIRRQRAKLVQEGIIKVSEPVERLRRRNEERIREEMR